jgi:hypothetical protein
MKVRNIQANTVQSYLDVQLSQTLLFTGGWDNKMGQL